MINRKLYLGYFKFSPFSITNSGVKSEELPRISVTNATDQQGQHFKIVRDLTPCDIASQEITKNAAEVFVAGEGHEGTAIRQHPDPVAQQP